jgi:hypothetical protein
MKSRLVEDSILLGLKSQAKKDHTLATALWQSVEIPTNSERFRRPLGSLSGLSILAGREFKDEAAVDLT